MRLFANKLYAMAAPEAVSLTDLPDELLAVISAQLAGHDYAFCALRRTCRALSRLDFDNYALAFLAKLDTSAAPLSNRPVMLGLLKPVINGAARMRRRAVVAAVLAADNTGTAKCMVARAAIRHDATELFAWFPFIRGYHASKSFAAEYGKVDTIKALFREFPAISDLERDELYSTAASRGQLAVCEYFYEISGDRLFTTDFVEEAVRNNSIPLCEFIARSPAGRAMISPVRASVIGYVAPTMTAAMLDWLGNHGSLPVIRQKAFVLACKAVQANNIGVLEYLEQFGADRILGGAKRSTRASGRVLKLSRTAAAYGACDALAWLNAHGLLIENREALANFAAQQSRVRALDWLAARGLDEHEFCAAALAAAADAGRLDVLEWARRRFNFPRAVFAKYAGRHETVDAFLASFDSAAA